MPTHAAIPCLTPNCTCKRNGSRIARYAQAGIPATQTFQTKPALARQMLERVFAVQVPLRWVTGDSVYGDDRRLRIWLEAQEQA